MPLPEAAEIAGEMLLKVQITQRAALILPVLGSRKAFTSPEDHRALTIALNIAARALPGNRWRFKDGASRPSAHQLSGSCFLIVGNGRRQASAA